RIDPETNEVVATYPTDDDPDNLLIDGSTLWISAYEASTLTRIDATSGRVLLHRPVSGPEGVVRAAGALWVASYDGAALVRLDPTGARVTGRWRATAGPRGLVAAFGRIYMACSLGA